MLHLSLAVATLLAAPTASTPPSIDSVFASLEKVRGFHDASISTDGRRAAWSQKLPDAEGQERLGAIRVADLSTGASRPLSAATDGKPRKEVEPVFSPDGRSIAFLSDAATRGQLQVWVAPAAGGAARRLTRVKGQLQELRWAPSGESVSFLFVEGSSQETGALVAHARDSGPVEENPEVQRIAIAEVATGKTRSVSPPELFVYDYDWSPDGKGFAAEAAVGSGTNNYWLAELYVVDAASGKARSIWKPPLQIACPRFSPDGRSIAVIHGIMSDEGSNGGDVWEVPIAAGGSARNLTPGMRWSAANLVWRSAGEILFAGHIDGGFGVAAIDPATGRLTTRLAGAEKLAHFGAARAGEAVVAIRESFQDPPEVWAGTIGAWRKVSSANAQAERFWGEARSLHWPSAGADVQGWLLYPRDYDASLRYPMVVVVHGGPSGAATAAWPSRWTATLPSQGYFVFLPNPRGSFGFGEAFAAANVKDFGGGDLADILAGVDAVLGSAPVDPKRARYHRLELRRLHDDVGRDADRPLRRRGGGSRHRELAELLRTEQDRHVDAPLLRSFRLRRPESLRKVLADRVHKEGEDAHARAPRRARLRSPHAPGLRVLARAEDARGPDAARDLRRRGARRPKAPEPARHRETERGVV